MNLDTPDRAARLRLLGLTAVVVALALVVAGLFLTPHTFAQSEADSSPEPTAFKVEVNGNFGFPGFGTVADLVPGVKLPLRIELENAGAAPTTAGLVGIFPSRHLVRGYVATDDLWEFVAGLGWAHSQAPLDPEADVAYETVIFKVPLQVSETAQFDIPYELVTLLAPGTELVARLGYCVLGDGETCPGAVATSTVPPPSFQWLDPVTATVRYRDLGDAPDSTNHLASPMPAYPTRPAHFPTVFDPATGADQGPSHLVPRPFHLGLRVSPEAEADIGPDLDPSNNIRPADNVPNRDRADDGLRLYNLAFEHCQSTVIPVRVLIHPAAVAYFQGHGDLGYLNIWLDSNRDGDWADAVACGDPPQPAIEQIVIDHPVNVTALGPGIHDLNIPTGLVPWPAAAEAIPAWLRVTLSERPSNKGLSAGSVDYGDGRGFALPFLLGETEDYFYIPPTAAGAGVDLEVQVRARLVPVQRATGTAQHDYAPQAMDAIFGYSRLDVAALIRNVGSAKPGTYVVKIPMPWSGSQGIRFDPQPVPGVLGELDGTTIVYTVAGLDEVVLTASDTNWCLTCLMTLDASMMAPIDLEVTVESDDDVDPSSNTAQRSMQPGLPAPLAAFTTPDSPFLSRRGTTRSGDVELRGRYLPGASMIIFVNGSQAGQVVVDGGGQWSFPLALAEGSHRAVAVAQWSGQNSPPSNAVRISVQSDLLWEPSSLVFTNADGRSYRPFDRDGNGSHVPRDWLLRLEPGEFYTVSVAYRGPDPEPEIAFFYNEPLPLISPHNDGIFVGLLVVPEVSSDAAEKNTAGAEARASLMITTSGTAESYEGLIELTPEATIRGSDGLPLEGARVTPFTETRGGTELGVSAYGVWPGRDYGQPTSLDTVADGEYAFWAPPGTYQLLVERDGYQPYRSWDIDITDEWLGRDLVLEEGSTAPIDWVVRIGRDGFDPPVLLVRPGSVVRWVNADADPHSTFYTVPGAASEAQSGFRSWNSGRLEPGEGFTVKFEQEGVYAYSDRANAFNSGEIIVDPNAPIPYQIFLPMVTRR